MHAHALVRARSGWWRRGRGRLDGEGHRAAGRTAATSSDIVKVFPYTPQEYAEKEMQYRDMRSLLIPNGFLTRTHFEGTTMTLQARERGPGGVWVIVEG